METKTSGIKPRLINSFRQAKNNVWPVKPEKSSSVPPRKFYTDGQRATPITKKAKQQPSWIVSRLSKNHPNLAAKLEKVQENLKTFFKFVGPGFMVAVAYMDPGNYSTDIAAGSQFRFHLLFVIFLSNCIAIFLQSLAIKLGTVTGRNLAQISREEFPLWLNVFFYILAEAAIIATDIAEVIGTAIALNILLKIPLIAGVIMTIVDVLIILLAYRPGSSMRVVHYFECGVAVLVLGVVICFAIQLSRIPPTPVADVFKGYLPTSILLKGEAMYASCGILGATVMPHSLYLGSDIVKPRLMEHDVKMGNVDPDYTEEEFEQYRPSVGAIRFSLLYSIIELGVSLFTYAFFVNSAILIIAGATLYGTEAAEDADLYSIHHSLSSMLSKGAGTLFMLALLFSGQSAGIICTISGQIVSEGYLNWSVRPWLRRIITRGIAIIPCVIVAGCVGRSGLNATLNASQVTLSILLPFLVFPLIYFTCKSSLMKINAVDNQAVASQQDTMISSENMMSPTISGGIMQEEENFSGGTIQEIGGEDNARDVNDDKKSETVRIIERAGPAPEKTINYTNNWITTIVGCAVWLFIAILNVYLIVQLGLGKGG